MSIRQLLTPFTPISRRRDGAAHRSLREGVAVIATRSSGFGVSCEKGIFSS
jgi:hypothetical protein